jgi:hypothetical protein
VAIPLLSAATISRSSECASVTSAPHANINGASTNTVITDVKIREIVLRLKRHGRPAAKRM